MNKDDALRNACADIAWLIRFIESGETYTIDQIIKLRGRLASYRHCAGLPPILTSIQMDSKG